MTDSNTTADTNASTTATIATPTELRSSLVAALKRQLFGPEPGHDQWPGTRGAVVVSDGASIASMERPVGPFRTFAGEEVLALNPRDLYLTGVLWGSHDVDTEDDDDGDANNGGPIDDGPSKVWTHEAVEHDDHDNEDLPDDVDDHGKRRSLALSFRVPASTTNAEMSIRFGTYSRITVDFLDRPHVLWERTSHQLHPTLDLTTSAQMTLASQQHSLTVGVVSRPDGEGSRLITVWVRNDTGNDAINHPVEGALFQVAVSITVDEVMPYARSTRRGDRLDLLYRDIIDLAVGHGTDVAVHHGEHGVVVSSNALPVVEVPAMTPDVTDDDGAPYHIGMKDLADFAPAARQGVERLMADYGAWIMQQRSRLGGLDDDELQAAHANLDRCEEFLAEVRAGWQLVLNDGEVRRCLADASSAMHYQRISSTAPLRRTETNDGLIEVPGRSPHASAPLSIPKWRPFQVAFVLASLPKIVDPAHAGRGNVDVVWMPTGGGKTEAYLGLAAFTILWQRRMATAADPNDRKASTKVLMRYTLRLLTVQQFLRSASLICALEFIRRDHPERYGKGEVRIGTWVGASTTPLKRETAVKKLRDALKSKEPHGFLLSRCPWCGAGMGEVAEKGVIGYEIVQLPNKNVKRVLAHCPDPTCPFARHQVKQGNVTLERGLPVLEVDEDVYDYPPDFVIGTVDKVAMMWSQTGAQRLFGLSNGQRFAPPPALFIQDELHLINGPLGSLNGMYEVMLEELCRSADGEAPLYVASTATTRDFERQIAALYDRTAALVPPPGVDISNGFFSRVTDRQPSRMYVGVCASGGAPNAVVQLAVLAGLAHFVPALGDLIDQGSMLSEDPYWTDVVFFSSRAALGTLTSRVESEMTTKLDRIRRASGINSGPLDESGQRRNRRWMSPPREITATASENVTDVLDDLGIAMGERDAIDLCFATSMIEVGLDVPRLGLMTVIGQPKGSSQYIQVTGRVGRSSEAPALVVDVLGTRTPRDRSHYERFTSWHRRLYAAVEGASVTPFTDRALDRSLPSIASILAQVLGGPGGIHQQVDTIWPRLTSICVTRAARFGSREAQIMIDKLDTLYERTRFPKVPTLDWSNRGTPESSFLFAFGEAIPAARPSDYWQVLTSMRSVDPDAAAIPHNPGVVPTSRVSKATDDEESWDL